MASSHYVSGILFLLVLITIKKAREDPTFRRKRLGSRTFSFTRHSVPDLEKIHGRLSITADWESLRSMFCSFV